MAKVLDFQLYNNDCDSVFDFDLGGGAGREQFDIIVFQNVFLHQLSILPISLIFQELR